MKAAVVMGALLVTTFSLAGPIFQHDTPYTVPVAPTWDVSSDGSTWYVLDATAQSGRSTANGQLQHWAWIYKERAGQRQEMLYAVQNCGAAVGILYEVTRRGVPTGSMPVLTWNRNGPRVIDHLAKLICLAALHRSLNIPPAPQLRLSPDSV